MKRSSVIIAAPLNHSTLASAALADAEHLTFRARIRHNAIRHNAFAASTGAVARTHFSAVTEIFEQAKQSTRGARKP